MKSFWHRLYVSNKYLATCFHFISFISKYCSFTTQTLYSFCFDQQGVFHINSTIILCSAESRSIKCKQWNQHVLLNTFRNTTSFSSPTNLLLQCYMCYKSTAHENFFLFLNMLLHQMFKATFLPSCPNDILQENLLPNNQILQVLQENLVEDLNDIKL